LEGVEWAVQQGADVINLSLGGSNYSQTEENYIRSIRNQGILVFASSGNAGNDAIQYPSGYESCISVGSVDQSLNRSGKKILQKERIAQHSLSIVITTNLTLYTVFLCSLLAVRQSRSGGSWKWYPFNNC
jgi:subtilisin family serine protease